MAKKSAMRIALDLETTGLHPEQDAILEVAAIKFQENEVVETFETFVAPGRSIPYRVQRLTGIKPEHVADAPPFASIAKKLQNFLGDYPIVGHSIPFDVHFLQRRGLARTNPLIDTFELATVLLPSLTSYNLGQVAEALGVRVPEDRHRAMVDTVLAMEVFLVLHQQLASVDLAMLNDLANLDAPRSWPLLHFFRQEVRDRQERDGLHGTLARGSLGDRFAAQLGMDPRVLSFAVTHQAQVPAEVVAAKPLAVQQTADEQSSTPLPELLDRIQTFVESAGEQNQPAAANGYQTGRNAIRDTLEQKTSLCIEITVGGHDYTPALLPVLEWLTEGAADREQPRRLVIACATQQSARRLVENGLPRLQELLKSQLTVAYLAERGGYLCTHRWFGAALRRTSGELTAEQARGLAKLGLWAQQTLYGERGELTLLQQEAAAWERISSGVERLPSTEKRGGTIYERCTYRKKGYCFVSLAEERVNAANIVVTTHGGLFDDLAQPHSLLARIDGRMILDADLLEEENARWNGTEFDQNKLNNLLNTIGVELPNGRYQGLLALAAPTLRENGPGGLSKTPTVAKAELDARMLNWFQTLRQTRTAFEKLFSSFSQLLEEFAQQGNGSGRTHGGRAHERLDQPLRLNGQVHQLGRWMETERAWQHAAQRLQTVINLAHEVEKIMVAPQGQRSRIDVGGGEDTSVASELIVVANQLEEHKRLIQRALTLGESDTVYWLRMPPTPPFAQQAAIQRNEQAVSTPEATPVLYSQLVQVSDLLKRVLLKANVSTIFAGTALTVDSTFSFIHGRLGIDNDNSAALSLVTEHHEQTLLYMPDDVPEPNSPQYQRNLDETLIQLGTALEGQLVALFTSHAALRSSYATIKPLLEARGILVLGQGVDGSPRQLWQVYQTQKRVVLLGTGSFWDSVDEIPQSPTCLLIARLPMPVLNDPPMAARVEQYSDQLHQLTVPIAALRMRRMLNRLVWGDAKRNAVVLFDRRIITKEYGSMILHSLPRCSQKQGAVSHMPEAILDWLTAKGTWEPHE